MKRIVILAGILIVVLGTKAQESYTISASDFVFTPSELTVYLGDTVYFEGSSRHPVLEVNENNWNSNEDIALDGGFSFSSGSGTYIPEEAKTYYYVCENHVSSGMKGYIEVLPLTNLEQETSFSVALYPVPVQNNNLNIELENNSSTVNVSVFNTIGVQILSKKFTSGSDNLSLNVEMLKNGVYLLQVETNSKVITKRFMVEKH